MHLEVETILVMDSLTTVFLVFVLLFFRRHQKTYPGFGFWIAGMVVAAVAHVAVLLRNVDLLLPSVILNNGAYVLAVILRLDGVRRFMRGASLPAAWYLLPVAVAAYATWFTLVDDSISQRSLGLSLAVAVVAFIVAYELVRYAPAGARPLYRVGGAMTALFGVGVLVRAVQWSLSPTQGIFDGGSVNLTVAVTVLLYEMGWGFMFLMMNSQRLESELRGSQGELQGAVDRLEKARSEVKVLAGLLPICASCKSIRDDKGYWTQIEAYIATHSEARFSHGVCPSCMTSLYPDTEFEDE